MCGRYRLSRRKQLIEEYFASVSGEDDWTPRYNIAPTQSVPVIRQNSKEPRRELSLLRWGLIPSWAKDPSVAAQMINARSETAATKPVFRDPLSNRRCLIPADGFYEWQRRSKAKQPLPIVPETALRAISLCCSGVSFSIRVLILGRRVQISPAIASNNHSPTPATQEA